MRCFLQKRIFPLIACFVFVAVWVLPVMAAEDTSGIVQLSDPSKIFNDDGTVTVTYDLPLAPYSEIYGMPVGENEFVQVGTSTNIYFTQDKDEYLTVFTSLYDFEAVSSNFNLATSINSYTSPTKTGSGQLNFDISHCTHLLIDGVAYPMIFKQYSWQTVDYLGVLTTTGSIKNLLPGQYGLYSENSEDGSNVLFSYMVVAGEPFDGFVQVGYYEDVMISQHEYDALYPLLFPFGRTNYIDVSNIRSGGSFEVSVTYDYNIILDGTDTTTDLIQHIDFYDKNFRLISTTSSVTTPFDVANGASSTIDTTVTVPEGACYMDMELTTDPFAVSDVQLLDWRVSDMEMTLDMSDVEANSLMMSGIIDRLDTLIQEALEANENLDEIIELLEQIIADMSSSGCDHSVMEDLLQQLLDKQDDILSGGSGGGILDDTSDKLDQGNAELGGAMDKYNDAAGKLPQFSPGTADVILGNLDSFEVTNLSALMPWNDAEYADFWDAMFTPTLAAVSAALLLYFVFGKARSSD